MPQFVDPYVRRAHASAPQYVDRSARIGVRGFSVVLTAPGDVRFDVTSRVAIDAVGEIEDSTEEDVLAYTHGDVTLTIKDNDTAVERFLSAATPSDIYQLTITRDRVERRRQKYDVLFAGILDLPWSLNYDRFGKTVDVRAFSYSKLLERASAEAVKRALTGRTLTAVTSTVSRVVNVSSTTDVKPGDEIHLIDDTDDETQIVMRVTSGTVLEIMATGWSHVFASGTAIDFSTPYYRNKSPDYIAGLLFAEAGVEVRTIQPERPLAIYPVATPLSTDGITIDGAGALSQLRVMSVYQGRIAGWGSANRITMPNPRDVWTDEGAQTARIDWTIYQDTEPAALIDGFGPDITTVAGDYGSGDQWRYGLTAGAPGTNDLKLFLNGASVGIADNVLNSVALLQSCEWVEEDGHAWISWVNGAAAHTFTKYWDGAAYQTIEATIGGILRYIRVNKQVAMHEHQRSGSTVIQTTNLRIYDAATRAYIRTITVPQKLFAGSLRVAGGRITGLYYLGPAVRCRMWDMNWIQVADYEVSSARPTGGASPLLTVYRPTPGSNEVEYVIGEAGQHYFILAPWYAGVVPYADMAGLSVAAALNEIAMLTISYVNVDENKIGTIRSRAFLTEQAVSGIPDIGRPLEQTTRPVWEFYRASVSVTARDSNDNEITTIQGDTGDSARRLEVESRWATSVSLIETIGMAYAAFLSTLRKQEEVRISEVDFPVRVFGNVRLAGRPHLVIGATIDPQKSEQALKLVEVE